ncbi:LysR family transcriptional regulator [Mycetocola reblochoni]|uniref:Transcriptional regulator, LysR family n=2 Tax=Mycetocola reblochoni TaxID=331618 RepID=A0A1R4KA74_9MICO|nr:LysR family transcriptional regulator [Mycetocola reblochoni]RLP71189.1 LysR family transcriptional regulator [Mycetocola reblochoni]SJN41207.1 Transcriptional regulator, LysR family [Mycetocola reblochoni REB411]
MRTPGRNDISLTQLRYFVAAAENASMTWAADELFVAQSAVSTAISNLEASVGVQLLIRRRAKGLQLTAAGADFLARARGILSSVDDAVSVLRPENTAGRISIGCFRTLAPFYLPPIISALADEHPELQVDVAEMSADMVGPALAEQSIELALSYDLGLGPEVEQEVLAEVPLYAAVSVDHPLAAREEVSLAELAEEPMVLLDMPVSRDYFLQWFSRAGVRPLVRYRFASFEAVRAMVASGHGFTLLNQQPKVASTYSGAQLHRLRLRDAIPPLRLVLASQRRTEEPTSKAKLFAEQCRRTAAALAVDGVATAHTAL